LKTEISILLHGVPRRSDTVPARLLDLDQLALNNERSTRQSTYKNLELHRTSPRSSVSSNERRLILVTHHRSAKLTLDSILDLNNHTTDAHCVIIALQSSSSQTGPLHRPHRKWAATSFHLKEGAVQSLGRTGHYHSSRARDRIHSEALEITTRPQGLSTLHTSSAVESIDVSSADSPVGAERVRNRLRLIQAHLAETDSELDKRRVLAKEVMIATPS